MVHLEITSLRYVVDARYGAKAPSRNRNLCVLRRRKAVYLKFIYQICADLVDELV